jgi:hypothetical protein
VLNSANWAGYVITPMHYFFKITLTEIISRKWMKEIGEMGEMGEMGE